MSAVFFRLHPRKLAAMFVTEANNSLSSAKQLTVHTANISSASLQTDCRNLQLGPEI